MASMAQGGAKFAGQSAGSGAATHPALLVRGLAVEARASIDRLSDEVAAQILATVPELAADADLRGPVLDASVAGLAELVAVLAEPERPVDGEPPPGLMAIVGALVRRG